MCNVSVQKHAKLYHKRCIPNDLYLLHSIFCSCLLSDQTSLGPINRAVCLATSSLKTEEHPEELTDEKIDAVLSLNLHLVNWFFRSYIPNRKGFFLLVATVFIKGTKVKVHVSLFKPHRSPDAQWSPRRSFDCQLHYTTVAVAGLALQPLDHRLHLLL